MGPPVKGTPPGSDASAEFATSVNVGFGPVTRDVCPGRILLAEQQVLFVLSEDSSTATSTTSCRTAMLTPGIGPRFLAQNTPARRRILRPLRHGRHNFAQCFEAWVENRGISPKNGVRTGPSAFLTVGFRTDGAGTPSCGAPWVFPGTLLKGTWKGGPPGAKPLQRVRAAGLAVGIEWLSFERLRDFWQAQLERVSLPEFEAIAPPRRDYRAPEPGRPGPKPKSPPIVLDLSRGPDHRPLVRGMPLSRQLSNREFNILRAMVEAG
jgi:hypothetical protein